MATSPTPNPFDPSQFSALPAPEPPITPPTAGFGAWNSDARNVAKYMPSLMPQPGAQPLPPGVDAGGIGQSLFGDNAPQPANKPIDLGMPSVPPPTQAMDQANAPDAYGKPYLKNGNVSKWDRVAAGLMGFGGGVKGNPMAGANYIDSLQQHDLNLGK